MARLLVLAVRAGAVGARVGARSPWLPGAAAPCTPPPLSLPPLRPGPDTRLLCAARGDYGGRQDPSRTTTAAGSGGSDSPGESKLSKSQQLKKVFQEYGAVAVSLHIAVSLVSLGMFYTAVSSGMDMPAVLLKLGFKESLVQSKMAAGTSTFVVAYAVHKLFAPVRISITLMSVPFVVRHFRRAGLFKPPAAKP